MGNVLIFLLNVSHNESYNDKKKDYKTISQKQEKEKVCKSCKQSPHNFVERLNRQFSVC